MQIGHVGAGIQQPVVQAAAQLNAGAAQNVKAKNEEQSESRATEAAESSRGGSVNELA